MFKNIFYKKKVKNIKILFYVVKFKQEKIYFKAFFKIVF